MLIAANCYSYNGKVIDNLPKLVRVVGKLPALEKVVVVPFMRKNTEQILSVGAVDKAVLYSDGYTANDIQFKRQPFTLLGFLGKVCGGLLVFPVLEYLPCPFWTLSDVYSVGKCTLSKGQLFYFGIFVPNGNFASSNVKRF